MQEQRVRPAHADLTRLREEKHSATWITALWDSPTTGQQSCKKPLLRQKPLLSEFKAQRAEPSNSAALLSFGPCGSH